MSEHESKEAEEQPEETMEDLEVSDEESEEVKGGWKGVKPEEAAPHL